jgi:hypothetical protein
MRITARLCFLMQIHAFSLKLVKKQYCGTKIAREGKKSGAAT